MNCLVCAQGKTERPAVAVCHGCGAALCAEHLHWVTDQVTVTRPILQVVPVPVQQRHALCAACLAVRAVAARMQG